jgi:hypothetical protein
VAAQVVVRLVHKPHAAGGHQVRQGLRGGGPRGVR